MRQALENYKNYLDSDEEFIYVLRMEYQWYQNEFDRMISLIRQVINDYKDKDTIPKCIVFFFTWGVDFIIGVSSRDIFFDSPPEQYTKEQYAEMVKLGQQKLIDMRNKFYAGDYQKI